MVRQGANRGIKRCAVLFTKNGGSGDGSSKCGGGNGGPAVGLDRRPTRGGTRFPLVLQRGREWGGKLDLRWGKRYELRRLAA
jgi:hypothetical protein